MSILASIFPSPGRLPAAAPGPGARLPGGEASQAARQPGQARQVRHDTGMIRAANDPSVFKITEGLLLVESGIYKATLM